jgi:hypothetical protein
MEKPSFRSPEKIAEDILRLNEQGIKSIGLFQDPRMGGEKYWKELIAVLRDKQLDIDQLSMDIFTPVNEEFVREVASIGKPIILYFSRSWRHKVRSRIERLEHIPMKNYSIPLNSVKDIIFQSISIFHWIPWRNS